MRYFFHLRESGEFLADDEGCDLPDISAARAAAILSARSVISSEAMSGKIPLSAVLEVHDSQGQRVLDLPFRDAVILDS